MNFDPTFTPKGLLSMEPAGRREIQLALRPVLVSLLVFLTAVPFAKTPLLQVPAFVPMYVAALVICDLITAALLFGQFSVLRTPAILALAGGYLFTASSTFAYVLIFPGLFSPTGLFGAGPQTTSAMYMFWHGGFPIFVIAYTLFKGKVTNGITQDPQQFASARKAISATIAGILTLVAGFTLLATQAHEYIPVFLNGNRTTDLGRLVLFGVWLLSLAALVTVWLKKPHTVLDVWIVVVMSVWLFDIALAALLNTGRYDLGWYAGRIYGLLAASFLLVALMIEDVRQYSRLFQLSVKLSAANKVLNNLSRHDGMTGLANRRYFDEYLAEQIGVANRYKRPLALVLCDVDFFKRFNDRHGHQSGDECLQRVGQVLQSCCHRPADMAARYGGEEFALILPDTDIKGARQIAENVRSAVSELQIPHTDSSAAPHVSISSGVVELVFSMSAQQLITAADQRLYQAKALGRNQVA